MKLNLKKTTHLFWYYICLGFIWLNFFKVYKWGITTLLESTCKSNRKIVQYHGFLRETLSAVM